MTKPEFRSRFFKAITFSREFCARIIQAEMPKAILIDFGVRRGEPNHKGKYKVWGGRLLDRSQLENVDPVLAWEYLWVEGKVPVWINVMCGRYEETAIHLEIDAAAYLWENEELFMHAREGNPPFHNPRENPQQHERDDRLQVENAAGAFLGKFFQRAHRRPGVNVDRGPGEHAELTHPVKCRGANRRQSHHGVDHEERNRRYQPQGEQVKRPFAF